MIQRRQVTLRTMNVSSEYRVGKRLFSSGFSDLAPSARKLLLFRAKYGGEKLQ